MKDGGLGSFVLFCFFSFCFNPAYKGKSVKTLTEHKLKEQRIQLPHMTRNTDFVGEKKAVWKSHMDNWSLWQSRTAKLGEKQESNF